MSNIVISTDKLCKSFSNGGVQQHVLKNLDIDIYEGDFTVIMGSSGAGKSTLLYALSGMDKPTLGSIKFFDQEIAKLSNDKLAIFRRTNCGFVFQQMFLLDNMSILDNILAAGLLVRKDRKAITAKSKQLLAQVGLTEEIWRKFPAQLSGGETQRAAIVRALINQPKVLFADEPTGALNSAAGKAALDVLTEFNHQGQSIIMVTHDLRSARRGNRILYMRDGAVNGVCDLGKYVSNDRERHDKLQAFLTEMGWSPISKKQKDIRYLFF
jgi:putative ABC transport system ATP-binding protein